MLDVYTDVYVCLHVINELLNPPLISPFCLTSICKHVVFDTDTSSSVAMIPFEQVVFLVFQRPQLSLASITQRD